MKKLLPALIALSLLVGCSDKERIEKLEKALKSQEETLLALQEKGGHKTKVLKLLEVTGAEDMGSQALNQIMSSFARMPGLPEGFAKKFIELARPEEMVQLVVPIYMKHLEEKDIDALLKFFATESGKRWVAAQPKIAQESMAVGQEWGRDLGARTEQELLKNK